MEFTTNFGLQSQTTRLSEEASLTRSVAPAHGAITLSGAPFLGDFGRTAAGMALLQTTIRRCKHRRLQAWAVPASLAVTGGILVSFFSSAY